MVRAPTAASKPPGPTVAHPAHPDDPSIGLFIGLVKAAHRRDYATALLAIRQLRACGWSICRLGGRKAVRP